MSSRRILLGISAIVFVASAAMTIATGLSMSAMGEMRMPGGWTMSHTWMVMPGQSWFAATASFVGMWTVMMVAMMLPSLVPTLVHYHESLGHRVGSARAGWLTAVVAAAYFAVWTTAGVLVFPLGVSVAELLMREPSVAHALPVVVGGVVVVAGLAQAASWRALYLARRLDAAGLHTSVDLRTAWRHGLCLGLHCIRSCAGATVIALCLGIMDLRVMAAVAVAITAERRWHFVGRPRRRYLASPRRVVRYVAKLPSQWPPS